VREAEVLDVQALLDLLHVRARVPDAVEAARGGEDGAADALDADRPEWLHGAAAVRPRRDVRAVERRPRGRVRDEPDRAVDEVRERGGHEQRGLAAA
jgi:hypothetical protein